MDPMVDLTEDNVFRERPKKTEIVPVICWYGSYNDLEYLQNKIKLAKTRDEELVPKKEINLDNLGLNDTVTYTIRSHMNGGITYQFDTRANFTSTSTTYSTYTTSNTTNNWTVYQTGNEPTYLYTDGNSYNTIRVSYKMDSTEEPSMIDEVRKDLWGTSKLPSDEIPFYTKGPKDAFAWNRCITINEEKEPDWTELFPWYNRHSYNFEVFVNALIRHWISIKHDQAFASKSFDDVISARRVHWDEVFYQDVEYPWEFDIQEEEPKKPETFTEYIYDVAPWMVDMLRDVWRHSISPDLVSEYFTYNWHNITVPYYREKWFDSSDASNELRERGRNSNVSWMNNYFTQFTLNRNDDTTTTLYL